MARSTSPASPASSARSDSVWVRFEAPCDFVPPEARTSCVAYRAGWSGRVRRACWDQAKAAGAAVRIKAPSSRRAANAVRDDAADVGPIVGGEG